MEGNIRRNQIYNIIESASQPISANTLAKKFSVSRQVIVGDISLLRAAGHKIDSTPLGYIIPKENNTYVVVVKHAVSDTKKELLALVSCGVIILDVRINHPTYGLIVGALNIQTKTDVENFINSNPPLLSNLTDGIHSHTLKYTNKSQLELALETLNKLGFLYSPTQ